MAKKSTKVVEEVIENEVVTEVTPEVSTTSDAYNTFKAQIEQYAKANPVKFEAKKEALYQKLNTLK